MKRKIDSYKKGELINGIEFIRHITFIGNRRSIFKCPNCNKNWETRFGRIRNNKAKMCKNCSSIINVKKMLVNNKENPITHNIIITSNKSLLNLVFRNIRKSAKERNKHFELEFDFVINLISKNCEYCGCKPNQLKKNDFFEFKHHGIDRVKNYLPYENTNVVSCCKTCNQGKRDMPINEWYKYLNELVEFRIKSTN